VRSSLSEGSDPYGPLARRARVEPRPVVVDPRLYEHDFFVWLQSEAVPIGELYSVLERRTWRRAPATQNRYCRVDPAIQLNAADLRLLKLRLADRVATVGGEHHTGAVVLRSDGKNLTVVLGT
jgi:hypothetical protein